MGLYDIILSTICLLLGFVVIYMHQKITLLEIAPTIINTAEEKVKNNRLRWCTERLYDIVPIPLKLIYTKKTIKLMLKRVYNEMRKYADNVNDKKL